MSRLTFHLRHWSLHDNSAVNLTECCWGIIILKVEEEFMECLKLARWESET